MGKARTRLALAIAPAGQPLIPDRIKWLNSESFKTRVAHGYCSRQLAGEACPYANICEQCDNFVTTPEFIPALQAQPTDATTLRDDATERGWHSEVARRRPGDPDLRRSSPGTELHLRLPRPRPGRRDRNGPASRGAGFHWAAAFTGRPGQTTGALGLLLVGAATALLVLR